MKKCNSASKRDEFVIIPGQFPRNREPRFRNRLIGTSDMPKTPWLEHEERRRCSVAPQRASGQQARNVLRCTGRLPGRANTQVSAAAVLKHDGTQTGFRGNIVAPNAPISGIITCRVAPTLPGGSGAAVLVASSGLIRHRLFAGRNEHRACIRKSSYNLPPATNDPTKPSSAQKNGDL